MVANILTPRGPSLSLFPARAATVHIYAAKHPGCSRHRKELARLVAELPADARISLDRTSRLVAGLVRADLTRGKNETCGAPGLISPTFRAIHKKAKLSHVGDQDGNYTDGTGGDDFLCGYCGYVILENFDPSTVRGNPVYQCAYCENNNDFHSRRVTGDTGPSDDQTIQEGGPPF